MVKILGTEKADVPARLHANSGSATLVLALLDY
jgi:hypothetical protein